MHPKLLVLLHHIVEDGVNNGWTEVHDDMEHPSDEQIVEAIIQSVMDELNEYFAFDEE